MKERPILFSGPMVRAILEGRKTQTRRVIHTGWFDQSHWDIKPLDACTVLRSSETGIVFNTPGGSLAKSMQDRVIRCPYGGPGDRLWVRETFSVRLDCEPGTPKAIHYLAYKADDVDLGMAWHSMSNWKPSIHMPRWASRLTLEIVGVRAERVREISHKDALAEGVAYNVSEPDGAPLPRFRALWNSINDARGFGWDVNPWVWVVEFKVVKP